MEFRFSKYQATGNDFIVVNGDRENIPTDDKFLSRLCHRRFGAGADGVLIIQSSDDCHFQVTYYNPDGSKSFCGNGARAAVRFAHANGLAPRNSIRFKAHDGIHHAGILDNDSVRISMRKVQNVRFLDDGIFLDTGSPHLVRFVDDVDAADVLKTGRELRYSTVEGGTNVNFVENRQGNSLSIRTYERGVEDETYSCGTGVTASAIAASFRDIESPVAITTRGGELEVEYIKNENDSFSDIYLTGPAEHVFDGVYKW